MVKGAKEDRNHCLYNDSGLLFRIALKILVKLSRSITIFVPGNRDIGFPQKWTDYPLSI